MNLEFVEINGKKINGIKEIIPEFIYKDGENYIFVNQMSNKDYEQIDDMIEFFYNDGHSEYFEITAILNKQDIEEMKRKL